MNRNMLIRTIVAAVAIPIILTICYAGGGWLFGMVTLFAVAAMSELMIAEGYKPGGPVFWLGLLTMIASMLIAGERLFDGTPLGGVAHGLALVTTDLPLLALVFIVSAMVFTLGRKSPAELFMYHGRFVWGMMYLTLLYPYVFAVGEFGSHLKATGVVGGDWLLFLFGLLWLGDSAAMWVGQALGKTKLAPTVSPNKTVEGFLGGIFGSMIVALILGFWRLAGVPLWHLLIMAIACSVVGQLGDLVESMWKRSLGLKDSSAIIPGHGGVLDRFDSLLFAAPVMYLYMRLFLK